MFTRASTNRSTSLRQRNRSVPREETRKSHKRERLALVDWIVLAEGRQEHFRQRRGQRHRRPEGTCTRGRVYAGERLRYVSHATCEDVQCRRRADFVNRAKDRP